MRQVYRVGLEYLHITKECPPAFPGVLFVCYRGVSPSTVTETVIPKSDIPPASARVNPLTLPPDWVEALRLPKPAPAPALTHRRASRDTAVYRTRTRQADHTDDQNGLDRLYRQLAENPATCILLAPFTLIVIILWAAVLIGRWAISQKSL